MLEHRRGLVTIIRMATVDNFTDGIGLRQCALCLEWFPETSQYFHRNSKSSKGLLCRCKSCKNGVDKGWIVIINPFENSGKKRCSNGEECLNPRGPILPATTEYFYTIEHMSDGLQTQCKTCLAAKGAEYRQTHKAEHNASNRDWMRRNPHKYREYAARWRKKYPIRARIMAKEKYAQNPTAAKVRHDRYVRRHPERVGAIQRAATQKRRTAKINLPVLWNAVLENEMRLYWDNKCAVCGQSANFWIIIASDHWIPLSDKSADNPGTVPWNMIPLCHSKKGANGFGSCNLSKRNNHPSEWLFLHCGHRVGEKILQKINTYFELMKQRYGTGENSPYV